MFVDAGVWPVGARSLIDALEGDGVHCRVLDASAMTPERLAGLRALVLPGGWAPSQRDALGERGRDAIAGYVRGGGRCLAVCAGAYLISATVEYDGGVYPYPIGLFDGVAKGPVPGLTRYPEPGPVCLAGGGAMASRDFLYSGGCFFEGGSGVRVLARYPDGSAAVIARRVGRGEVVLTGVHFERPAPADGGDDAPPPAQAAPILRALLGL